MAILTGNAIRKAVEIGDIELDPFIPDNIQPNSIDVRLGNEVRVFRDFTNLRNSYTNSQWESVTISSRQSSFLSACLEPRKIEWDVLTGYDYPCLDSKKDNPTEVYTIDDSGWIIKPGILYLMHCVETVHTKKFRTEIVGKSSIARLGITIHCTAAHAETGFKGQFTLESHSLHPVKVYKDMFIGQIIFDTVEGEADDYQEKGHYVGDAAMGAVPSRSFMQFR